jgi:hypothetical protein
MLLRSPPLFYQLLGQNCYPDRMALLLYSRLLSRMLLNELTARVSWMDSPLGYHHPEEGVMESYANHVDLPSKWPPRVKGQVSFQLTGPWGSLQRLGGVLCIPVAAVFRELSSRCPSPRQDRPCSLLANTGTQPQRLPCCWRSIRQSPHSIGWMAWLALWSLFLRGRPSPGRTR